ncbi:hypothetical protein IFM89_037041 [Coptis chinensis]|uniref:Pentatricopeptide repeat-containing protein n=1 Tax=Coptis chinensis TaxID=261450 RepID=A0A835HB77_9MAGN|nr:hypothetical protein IFM89_037041 [Coptis chinensis]
MPERNAVSYNSIISAFIRCGEENGVWSLFVEMMGLGFSPTEYTFGSLLSSSELELFQGFQLHCLMVKSGLLYSDAFPGTSLVGLFGRYGNLDGAMKLFKEMPYRNLVTWNSVISSFGHHGFVEESVIMFCELLRESEYPSERSFEGVLSGFKGLAYLQVGKQIHGLVLKTGSEFYTSVANSLVKMYVQCADVFLGEKVFEQIPVKDMVSWSIIIGTFAKSIYPGKALDLFLIMPLQGFSQEQSTFASVISSCAGMQTIKYGELIHAKAVKKNFQSDVFVGSALVDCYAKCNCLEQADLLFSELQSTNVVSWNALIAGHSNEDSHTPFYLLRQMIRADYHPNEYTFSAVLKSSSTQELEQLHCLILKKGYHQHEYVSSSLVASYHINGLLSHALSFATDSTQSLTTVSSNILAGIHNRSGQYQETQKLLNQIDKFDIVSWNTLIAACARSGDYRKAFELFKGMQSVQTLPDNYTLVSLLSISTRLCDLALGSAIHGHMIKMNFSRCDLFVCNILVDMYAKCGSMESSVKVFNEMPKKNLFSWTALISALGLHGFPCVALERFREMESVGIKPDRVAFIAVLSACRHGGLVEEGLELFGRMKGYNVEPEMDHYICVVDLLARNGHLKEAEKLISGMPFQPNVVIWRTFLEGCRRYSDVEEAA